MSKVNHPSHYNAGTSEVINIIDSWGLAADFDAGNVLKYFLRAPYKNHEEEDYRKANFYLERIYDRGRDVHSRLIGFDNMKHIIIRPKISYLNLDWFYPIDCFGHKVKNVNDKHMRKGYDVKLREVIDGWNLDGHRQFFMEYFYPKNFKIEACFKALEALIDEATD